MTNKKLLFSVTAADCDWNYTVGTGAGGQKRNKTATKVRCIHRESKAMGVDDTTRSQHKNKQNAFAKMAATPEFQKWHKRETAKRMNKFVDLDEWVEKEMKKVRVEIYKNGKWVLDHEDRD